jgi:hypothetical protein
MAAAFSHDNTAVSCGYSQLTQKPTSLQPFFKSLNPFAGGLFVVRAQAEAVAGAGAVCEKQILPVWKQARAVGNSFLAQARRWERGQGILAAFIVKTDN